jgi:hypothetical protein
MTVDPNTKFFIQLVGATGLVSGVVVALFNHLITLRKSRADRRKVEQDIEMGKLQMILLKKQLSDNTEGISETISYYQTNVKERILYDSNVRDVGHDFTSKGGHVYSREKGIEVKSQDRGKGEAVFQENTINLKRTNTTGRFELWLDNYMIENKRVNFIPKDEINGIKRNFKLSLYAKTIGADHTLAFTWKGIEKDKGLILQRKERVINTAEWYPVTLYFTINPTEDCKLRIDDYNLTAAPSSIQLKDILLVENLA